MCLQVESNQQAAYIIAAVYLVYYCLSALTSAIAIFTFSWVWFSIIVLLVSLISIPFQYFLFDGAKQSIPEKVDHWIKFSMFVSCPYLVIILILRVINLNLDAIITVLALASLIFCIRRIKIFHAELTGGGGTASAPVQTA